MTRFLFSEINSLYASSKESPNVIHFIMRMQDTIDGNILRHAVDTTMERYPYFAVKLTKMDDRYVFESNEQPVAVVNTEKDIELNSKESNFHMLAFSWHDDIIVLNICHALTDGTGAYELLRTLLYYYCSEFYNVKLSRDKIRLKGDIIPPQEWDDPTINIPDPPLGGGGEILPSLNPEIEKKREGDVRTVFGISIDESELMRFSSANDGSPGTMTALFLSRAIADVHPDKVSPIRISMCVNQRKALNAPLAHQSLVGGAWLEYKEKMWTWPIDKQAMCFRGMVFAQTRDESVLSTQASINSFTRKLLALQTDEERFEAAKENRQSLKAVLSATVSYIGKANFGEAEKYIKEFHTWAHPLNESILLEVSAVNHEVTIEFIQNFSDPVYFDAFLKELSSNGIRFEHKYTEKLAIPNVRLPWSV